MSRANIFFEINVCTWEKKHIFVRLKCTMEKEKTKLYNYSDTKTDIVEVPFVMYDTLEIDLKELFEE